MEMSSFPYRNGELYVKKIITVSCIRRKIIFKWSEE